MKVNNPKNSKSDKDNKNEFNENLMDSLLKEYSEAKDMENRYRKVAEPLNKEIKDYLLSYNIEKYESDKSDITAVISKTNKVSWVEPILIERLKKLGHSEAVKTIEVVDYEKLESLLYNDIIKEKKIEDCKNIKEIITLRIGVKK